MATQQIVVPVMVTVRIPQGATPNNQDIIDVLKIKSTSPKQVKVIGHFVLENNDD